MHCITKTIVCLFTAGPLLMSASMAAIAGDYDGGSFGGAVLGCRVTSS